MILYPDVEKSDQMSHLVASELAFFVRETEMSSPLVSEIAKAVEEFVSQHYRNRLIEVGTLFAFASRAMCAVGETSMASRILLFGTGLVRRAEWDVTGPDAFWILDIRRLLPHSDAVLELAVLSSLNTVLDIMAEIWDQTAGRGTLGLRRISLAMPKSPLGKRLERERKTITAEINHLCHMKLEQLRRKRSWQTTPRVMNLDF